MQSTAPQSADHSRTASLQAASRIIHEHGMIRLSRAEQIAFVAALLDPPPPNSRLRRAAAAYRKQMGL